MSLEQEDKHLQFVPDSEITPGSERISEADLLAILQRALIATIRADKDALQTRQKEVQQALLSQARI